MGQDKALLKFGERTLLEHLVEMLAPLFHETIVIVNERQKLAGLQLGSAKVYEDLIKNRGPLAGIYTGLIYSRNEMSSIFTCDMPFIDGLLIRQLVDFWEEDFDVICLEEPDGNFQPFPGIYLRSNRHLLRSLLNRGFGSLKSFFEVATVKSLVLAKEKIEVLTNMNTIEDYYQVLREKDEWVKGRQEGFENG
jgi:molybdopterin-guanine dinucleotide biosynthesis protein A